MEDEEFLNAIDNLHELIPTTTEKLSDDVLICECFCVSVREIKECLSGPRSDVTDLEFLSEQLQMGTSCGSCMKKSASWINKI